MPKYPYYKNRLLFIRRSLNTVINLVFGVLFFFLVIGAFYGTRALLTYTLSFEGYLGDVISIIVSILIFLLPLIGKIKCFLVNRLNYFKQKVYIFLCTHKLSVLSRGVLNYNRNCWDRKPHQERVITKAISILKSKRQGIFAIESRALGGKTTSAMLLLDFVGKNIDLLDLFVSLKHKILYFDGATEAEEALGFLSSGELLSDSVLIVDNVHKLNATKLTMLISKTVSNVEFLAGINKGCLVLLLYQTSPKDKSLIDKLNEARNSQLNTSFLLEDDLTGTTERTFKGFSHNIDQLCSTAINEPQILRQHLLYLTQVSKNNSIITFLNDVIFNKRIAKKPFASTIIASILIASFHGYIRHKALKCAMTGIHYSCITYQISTHKLMREGFLVDFPLLHSTFLLNEDLANCYKQVLFKNDDAKEIYYSLAKFLFAEEGSNSPHKWLYLFACNVSYSRCFDAKRRKRYFYRTLEEYSISYLLKAIETELTIAPDKTDVFFLEIGILYINNGQWKKARQILKPQTQDMANQEEIWLLQLKIIEADHGTDDHDNLIMLSEIRDKSSNSFTKFLARFWDQHIHMEQGHFSPAELESLRSLINENREWEAHEYYDNTLRKLNSDSARTYFLTGHIDYALFQNIMQLIEPPYLHYTNSEVVLQKKLLTQAHYVHYDIIYQLGIWGYYKQSKVDPQFQGLSLNQIVEVALNAYDDCIRTYKAAGDKKWRTVQVRRDELSLCDSHCNYAGVINRLDTFFEYAVSNDIGVFKGFCDTMRGKAFAIYAISVLAQEDYVRYDQFIASSLEHLNSAISIYNEYGNVYGAIRAEFLRVVVSMLEKRAGPAIKKKKEFEKHFSGEIQKLLAVFKTNGWKREEDVSEYLLSNLTKYNTLPLLLKYYTIILQ